MPDILIVTNLTDADGITDQNLSKGRILYQSMDIFLALLLRCIELFLHMISMVAMVVFEQNSENTSKII